MSSVLEFPFHSLFGISRSNESNCELLLESINYNTNTNRYAPCEQVRHEGISGLNCQHYEYNIK